MNYFGCSGFYYPHWVGAFYPVELPKSKWLEFYSERFNALEVNSSFYHLPKEKTIENWRKRTPQKFRIVLKASRGITHYKKFSGTKRMVKKFYKLASLLEEKLAGILFQLPPSLHKSIPFLEKAFEQLDLGENNFFEFRHNSWFDSEVYDFFKKHGACFCSVSAPKRYKMPEELIKTTDNTYVRFHGRDSWYRYNYSGAELRDWAERIRKAKAKNCFAFFNNDFEANAARNCLALKKMVKE